MKERFEPTKITVDSTELNKEIEKNPNNKLGMEVMRQLNDKQHENYKKLEVKIASLKAGHDELANKYIDKINLLGEVMNLKIAVESEDAINGNLENEQEKLQTLNEKKSEWTNFTESNEYKEFEKMNELGDEINKLEVEKKMIDNFNTRNN